MVPRSTIRDEISWDTVAVSVFPSMPEPATVMLSPLPSVPYGSSGEDETDEMYA